MDPHSFDLTLNVILLPHAIAKAPKQSFKVTLSQRFYWHFVNILVFVGWDIFLEISTRFSWSNAFYSFAAKVFLRLLKSAFCALGISFSQCLDIFMLIGGVSAVKFCRRKAVKIINFCFHFRFFAFRRSVLEWPRIPFSFKCASTPRPVFQSAWVSAYDVAVSFRIPRH